MKCLSVCSNRVAASVSWDGGQAGKQGSLSKVKCFPPLNSLEIDCVIRVLLCSGEFPQRKNVLRWGPQSASPWSSSLLLFSALIPPGCCSGPWELRAKPSQRILWELGVRVSAMEGDAVEVLRDPPTQM